jgi:hypothetical protein
MIIKYFGTSWETGMTLTTKIFDYNGQEVGTGHAMTETGVDTAIYKTDSIVDENNMLPKGVYVARTQDDIDGTFLGYGTFIWDGIKEVTLETLDTNTWTDQEMMQIRDALGIDGNKAVATGGQLQYKSEEPSNELVNTNIIK